MNPDNPKQKIHKELLSLLNSNRSKHLLAAVELAESFQPLHPLKRGEKLWREGDECPFLFYLEAGALVEVDAKVDGTSILRLVVPGQLFWCEDVFFYHQAAQTALRALAPSPVWHLSKGDFERIHANHDLGFDLINALSLKTLGNYRARTAQLVQLSPVKRLAHALNQYPALLSLLSREELANFLALSRSSLHRVLKQGYGRK
jgi:CRP-like cAMP-binding protein